MSTLSTKWPTLVDVTKITSPNGGISEVSTTLTNYNDILEDIPWYEANLATGHQLTLQKTKPTPVFRLLNSGITPQKATTGQVTEACAIMENRNEVDVDVADLNGNSTAFRASQDKPMIEGFSDTLATKLIYGDSSVTPEEFNGLASRYFSLGTTYLTSSQMIDGGGTGTDNTSIYLVGWGENKVFGIYPKASQAGLKIVDEGIRTALVDATNYKLMRVYSTWMQWKCGLAVADYRYVVRICNLDVSDLATVSDGSDSSANILKFMSFAMDLLPPDANIRPVFYMNNKVRQALRVKLANKSNAALQISDYMGASGLARKQLEFYGIPCRRIDALVNTESRITVGTT